MKIFAGRGSLIGDTIMFLPVLKLLERHYPKSYKIFPISKKTSQSAPLFINHPLIDKIYILKEWESIGNEDLKLIQECDIAFNPFPNHPEGNDIGISNFWYNKYDCVTETARMAGIEEKDILSLSEQERKPKLEKWFPIDRHKGVIAIWGYAGYGGEKNRNPTEEWWDEVVSILVKDYFIYQLGAEKEPPFLKNENSKIKRLNHLPFFEQIKISLGCDLCINTDSGSGWALGAYGANQINLMTNHGPGHTENFLALCPPNIDNKSITLFAEVKCSNIQINNVIDSVKKFS